MDQIERDAPLPMQVTAAPRKNDSVNHIERG